MEMMTRLIAWMNRLEKSSKHAYSKQDSVVKASSDQWKSRVVVCYRCGQEGHCALGCVQTKKPSNQGNKSPLRRLP